MLRGIKGTGDHRGTDIDLFISLSHATPDTLKEIYQKLLARMRANGYTSTPLRAMAHLSLAVPADGPAHRIQRRIDELPARLRLRPGFLVPVGKRPPVAWHRVALVFPMRWATDTNRSAMGGRAPSVSTLKSRRGAPRFQGRMLAAMVERTRHVRRLQQLLRQYQVVAVLGARQVGKTTLAHALVARVKRPATFFDLERRGDRARLADPDLALAPLRGIVVLD